MKVGDLVACTYGEGQRPMGIIVGWYNASRTMARVIWAGDPTVNEIGTDYLEVISESR